MRRSLVLDPGTPLRLSATSNKNNFGPGERPNWTGINPKISGKVENRLNEYFNTALFSQLAAYTYGNMTRTIGALRNPRSKDVDTSLFKEFQLVGQLRSQLQIALKPYF